CAALSNSEAMHVLYLRGYKDFSEGDKKYLKMETSRFLVPPKAREQAQADARLLFRAVRPYPPPRATMDSTGLAAWHKEGDKVIIRQDFFLPIIPREALEGTLVMETDAGVLDGSVEPAFVIRWIELDRARTAPVNQPPQPPPPPR